MPTSFIDTLRLPAALLAGGAIGLLFGLFQDLARRRYERLQQEGKFTSGWAATPGSFRRVAYLLVALAAVQFLCPVFFDPHSFSQWWVSAGVVAGYGVVLFRELRRRLV